jgi:ribosomal protein S27AE
MSDFIHGGLGPPGWRCRCGAEFDDYYALAEHVRLSISCPRCGAAPSKGLASGEVDRWRCGHWIARGDFSATIREADEALDHYPTHGPDADHVACACGHAERVDDDLTAALRRVSEHVRAAQQVQR